MNKQFLICIEKVYANQKLHTIIFNKANLKIMGVYQSYKETDFLENVSEEQKEQILKYLHENCMDSNQGLSKKEVDASVFIKLITLGGIEKALLIKGGISVIGVYQNGGVDFIENLPKETKEEAVKKLYQFGYLNADKYAWIMNKLEPIQF